MESLVYGFCLLSLAVSSPLAARQGPTAMVQIEKADRETIEALTDSGYDIASVRGATVTVFATEDELRELAAQGYAFTRITAYPSAKAPTGYRTYSMLTQQLAAFATRYPFICRVDSLGTSTQGRDIWAILISDNPDIEEDEPEFKYVSTIHGNEPLGTELCMRLVERLLTDYGVDPRITDLVDTTAISVVPLMNPDGYQSGFRTNAQGYDLNRSFPIYATDFTGALFDGESLGDSGRPVEVGHIMRWSAANSFTLSANFHTGALVVNYPYDDDGSPSGWDTPTPDDPLFEDVARRYSRENPPMWASAYFEDGITNGCAWYRITGGMQDWNYRYLACNEVTIELCDTYAPDPSLFPSLWENNEEAMLRYIEAVHIGVRGVVSEKRTGAPVWAKVSVEGNAHAVYTDPDVGDYHRMLLPGTYALRYSSPGYTSCHEAGVVVGTGSAVRRNVVLVSGDVNVDGQVDMLDINAVADAVLGLPVVCDCDFDGGLTTITDLQIAVNVLLGQP